MYTGTVSSKGCQGYNDEVEEDSLTTPAPTAVAATTCLTRARLYYSSIEPSFAK